MLQDLGPFVIIVYQPKWLKINPIPTEFQVELHEATPRLSGVKGREEGGAVPATTTTAGPENGGKRVESADLPTSVEAKPVASNSVHSELESVLMQALVVYYVFGHSLIFCL